MEIPPYVCWVRQPLKRSIPAALEDARRRTLGLLAPLPDAALIAQHSPLMSPMVWDLAHVANYEEQWLLRALGGTGLVDAEVDRLYDAFRHPRNTRPRLPLMTPPEARAYAERVRYEVLAWLDRLQTDGRDDLPLLVGGFVYGMVVQHEHQHAETLLATLQLMETPSFVPPERPAPRGRRLPSREARVPGGRYRVGADDDDEAWPYDNERPAHEVELPSFFLDTAPVSNADFLAFMEAGGYRDPRLWADEGWRFLREHAIEAPLFWRRDSTGGWVRRRFGRVEAVPLEAPVQHVCWFEADAFARWAGRRLPTEIEWELAASVDPAGRRRRHPWGDEAPDAARANLWNETSSWAPAAVGAFPGGASPLGLEQLLGDVWEWTASDFRPWPGFRAFPYREYSEVFFGPSCKVLRGGSWATHPAAIRNTFRNWDYPIRRQIFAGFRTARDA